MRLVLYQPEIPQNAGALLRLGANLGMAVDIVGPAGFVLDDRKLRRAGMDYIDHVTLAVHESWDAYRALEPAGRLVLLTTAGAVSYTDFAFAPDDRLMIGRESSGVPGAVHAAAAARLRIPVRLRSLNAAQAAAMVVGEALRQTGGFPP